MTLSVEHKGFAMALRRSTGPNVFEGRDEESGTDTGIFSAESAQESALYGIRFQVQNLVRA